ncbi:AAA family ATPase, partial [Escherichia coli]
MEAIEWVQSVKMSPHIGRRMIDIFGPQAIATVRQSPFVLLALGAPWPNTLALAESLGFGSDSPETLCAIVERAAANLTRDTGDIAIDEQALKIAVSKLTKQKIAIEHLVNIAVSRRALIRVGKHGLVPIGAALIEDTVARALTKRIQRRPGAGTKVAQWECLLTMAKVQAALARFESTLPFELTIEQREAVVGAVMSPVACISGGAGTGKTTILQAVLGVYQDISRG